MNDKKSKIEKLIDTFKYKGDFEDSETRDFVNIENNLEKRNKCKSRINVTIFLTSILIISYLFVYLLEKTRIWTLPLVVGFFILCFFVVLAHALNITVFSQLVNRIIFNFGRNKKSTNDNNHDDEQS